MLFSPSEWCRPGQWADTTFSQPLTIEGEGLWAGVISSGQCVLDAPDAEMLSGRAGSLLLASRVFHLVPAEPCHLVAVQLLGRAAEDFAAELSGPLFADGRACPHAAELLSRLQSAEDSPEQTRCGLAFALLCELAEADTAAPALPPLVAEALVQMRENYAGLYGVEELSESLGVSKCHLVRVFSAAMGMPPGQYLTLVRIEAAKQMLLHREYSLDVVASLCGFSGANYLCRVFKKVTGQTPAVWRSQNSAQGILKPLRQEQEMYV